MRIYLNGKFFKQEEARLSVWIPVSYTARGLFETMRAYNGKVFRLDSHIQRLVGSLSLIGIDAPIGGRLFKRGGKKMSERE